jgi:hypothetical protein
MNLGLTQALAADSLAIGLIWDRATGTRRAENQCDLAEESLSMR